MNTQEYINFIPIYIKRLVEDPISEKEISHTRNTNRFVIY